MVGASKDVPPLPIAVLLFKQPWLIPKLYSGPIPGAAPRRFARVISRAILPPQNGFLFLDKAKLAASFAAAVAPDAAAFMADAQVPGVLER